MSDDFENELLGLAEDEPHHRSKKRHSGGGARQGNHSYVDSEDDNEEDMDMDLDSDDDAAPAARPNENPYPIEGKYKNEDDRDWLDQLPEIERESILASRQEEMQKYKDAMQIAAMYSMVADKDEDDDHRGKRQRKHTSVTNEASRAMQELKARRKSKDERVQRRAARREERGGRARSSSVASQDDMSSEEGEISRDPWRASSPSRRPLRDDKPTKEDLDSVPATKEDLNDVRLGRYDIVDMMYKDQFEDVVTGAYVRLVSGPDENGRPKYRIMRINGFDKQGNHGKYDIEYKGRQYSDTRGLVLQYGSLVRVYRIADLSNGEIDEAEFDRFLRTSQADNVPIPKRSALRRKHEAIVALRDRVMTEDEVNRQVEMRKQTNPAQRQKTVLQISSLYSSMQAALRRKDLDAAENIKEQIKDLGGDPTTGQLMVEGEMSEYDARIQRINENNRQRTKANMQRAHELALARKKAEEAIVKAKTSKKDKTVVAEAPPVSGLKRGETPQQYIARTFVLDLGDF